MVEVKVTSKKTESHMQGTLEEIVNGEQQYRSGCRCKIRDGGRGGPDTDDLHGSGAAQPV